MPAFLEWMPQPLGPLPTLGRRGESAESGRVPPAEAIARRRRHGGAVRRYQEAAWEADAAQVPRQFLRATPHRGLSFGDHIQLEYAIG
jgi:hypothetical protein